MSGREPRVQGIGGPDMDRQISVRDAYLSMFLFLESYWEHVPKAELAEILGTLALWEVPDDDKAPMDGAVLPQWLEAVRQVLELQSSESGYRGADIQLGEDPNS